MRITYYAVIALDGDSMGKWLSGQNAPSLYGQLSGDSIKSFFRDNWKSPDGFDIFYDQVPRCLTPSYHAAFSEALANFANYCVEPIIDKFDGQLIYAGGDDVLAMVPAKTAVDCADALQHAFRGIKPESTSGKTKDVLEAVVEYEWSEMQKKEHVPGFLKLKNPGSSRPKYPMLMPGPGTTVSCGIAIGHCKAPMRNIIQAAREAEKNAKDSGKDGFTLTVMKRSGEQHSFFSHWRQWVNKNGKWEANKNSNRHELQPVMEEIDTLVSYSLLSKGFPYKFCQMAAPLLRGKGAGWIDKFDEDMSGAIEEFLRICLERQGEQKGDKRDKAAENARRIMEKFKLPSGITPSEFMNFWMAQAFIQRLPERKKQRGGEDHA